MARPQSQTFNPDNRAGFPIFLHSSDQTAIYISKKIHTVRFCIHCYIPVRPKWLTNNTRHKLSYSYSSDAP